MLSPSSKGLFQRAISNSGSIYNTFADPWRKNEAFENAKRLASALNCPTTNGAVIVKCLKSKDAMEVILATEKAGWRNRVVIEDFEGLSEEAFLSKRTFEKESINIPWLIGMNTEEGLIFTENLFANETLRNQRIETWNDELPRNLDYDHLDEETKKIITKKITQFYFGTDTLNQGFSLQKLTDVSVKKMKKKKL